MIQVTMLDTVELATYSVRTFALYKVGVPPATIWEERDGSMLFKCPESNITLGPVSCGH